ncbi:MAG: xylose isomerase [Phycisphaerae bacterium]
MVQHKRSRRAVLAAGVSGVVTAWGAAHAAESNQAPRPSDSPAGAAPSRVGPLPPVLKTSIAAYSYRSVLDTPGKPGQMSLFDLVDLAARLQLDAIEPTSYYFLRDDDEFILRLKRHTFLAGLEISGTPVRNNFCQPPGPELEKEIAHVRSWVDRCVKLGSPAIRVFAGSPSRELSREQVFPHLVAAMKEAAAHAASRGVFLGLENHGYMTETADDVLRVVDAVGNDWLGVNLDTGNFQSDPYAQIAKLAPRAVICQVKIQVAGKGPKERLPADFPRIAGILREARYRGYVALEYEGKDALNEIPIYLAKLKQAMGG